MRKLNLFTLIIAAVALLVTGCEGPAGPMGANGIDGVDGVDGNVTCLACHSSSNMQDIAFQFAQSVHVSGAIAVDYAGGRGSCAECHSHEGFLAATSGQTPENLSSPSAWECGTCHSLHTTFEEEDYALRVTEPLSFIYDETVIADFGNGNLCSNCHQSRRAEPNVDVPGTTFAITSTHYGPHHGAQSNVVYGGGFAEIAGSLTYPAAGTSQHFDLSCTGCHMDTYTDGTGGHTWNPSISACTPCHSSATDFNVGGGQAEIAALLEELRDALIANGVVEFVVADDAYEPVVGTFPMEHAQAFFNWIGLEEDRSLGAHNPVYVKALLTNSIEALAP
ncbi:MAG: hypothetical protein K9H49_12445 [Bacteroidales bacterium]|nr:hypothetical protein [Bacteroidales bacterium]MCF8390606.1 hypothetical protein [Bacteroidales bacterium]